MKRDRDGEGTGKRETVNFQPKTEFIVFSKKYKLRLLLNTQTE